MENFTAGFLLGLIVAAVLAEIILDVENTAWKQMSVQRGYASYCPMDGKWAWKGECKE